MITSYVLRFLNNLRAKVNKEQLKSGPIDGSEINAAERLWLKSEQKFIRKDTKFEQLRNSLNLVEEDGLLKLRGRLSEAPVDDSFKYPILLRKDSHFTKLVIREAHRVVEHQKTNATLNEVRSRFWICQGRRTVNKIVSRCIYCKMFDGKTLTGPPSPDLPKFRVSDDFAFSSTGIDFAGPLYVKQIYNNETRMFKAYILLFTCATTRNVHLELTPGMDCGSLIRALHRFLSRRGYIKLFISDNFKSFG